MELRRPGSDERWRCAHCGNLTRFDVRRKCATDEYWHFDLSGEPEISEVEVLSEDLQKVSCRWCGSADRIEIVPRPDADQDVDVPLGGTP